MMPNRILTALLAPVAVVALASAAYAKQGDPIPSKDIVLQGDPDNSIVARTQTGRDGRFVIEGVRAGAYKIRIPNKPAPRAAINTTRSNIKKPSSAMVQGVQVVTIEAEMGLGPAFADIVITSPRGRIVGKVTQAPARPR